MANTAPSTKSMGNVIFPFCDSLFRTFSLILRAVRNHCATALDSQDVNSYSSRMELSRELLPPLLLKLPLPTVAEPAPVAAFKSTDTLLGVLSFNSMASHV